LSSEKRDKRSERKRDVDRRRKRSISLMIFSYYDLMTALTLLPEADCTDMSQPRMCTLKFSPNDFSRNAIVIILIKNKKKEKKKRERARKRRLC
jgi:hypothetical protein